MTTAQPGQEQRMGTISAKEMRDRLLAGLERPTADLGEDGELVAALGDVLDIIAAAQAEFSRTDEHKAYYSKRHEQVQQARDRLILYRKALEAYVAAHDAWIEKDAGINAAIHAADAVVKASNNARAVLSRSGG